MSADLAGVTKYADILACPRCVGPLRLDSGQIRCRRDGCKYAVAPFPLVHGSPVLVDFEASVVSLKQLESSAGASPVRRDGPVVRLRTKLNQRLFPNEQAARNVDRLLRLLREEAPRGRRPLLLVVGGGAIGNGVGRLYDTPDIERLGFDIYWSPAIQFIADAHHIPLADGSVDGVVIQAVLEHVLEPQSVVDEIHRVLRADGIVYSDTPFLQQVHEGAYDFTRFTESGHRYLFRDFERLDSGVGAGAGTQLVWSIDYFMRALFRSRVAGSFARFAFSWLARLDPLLDSRFSTDGASSVYFLGRRASSRISPQAAIDHYQGAQ